MATLLVRNARIVPLDRPGRIVEGSLLSEEGRIVALGRVPPTRADLVVDARGDFVTPGLVNAHTHLPMALLRGMAEDLPLEEWLEKKIWPAESKLDETSVRAGMRLGLLELLRSGTTLFADMYFFPDALSEEVERSGLFAVETYPFLDFPVPGTQPQEAPVRAREFLKRWGGNPHVVPGLGPHSTYTCSSKTLEEVAHIVSETPHPVPILTHLSETRTEVLTVEKSWGMRPLRVLESKGLLSPSTVLAHCGWITKEEVRKISENLSSVAHCPHSNLKLATGAVAPIVELLEGGATVALGTDGPASNNTLDLLETARIASLLQKSHRWDATALPAWKALEMATVGGARALGQEALAGTLEVGKRADFVVWNTKNPRLGITSDPATALVYSGKGEDARVVVAGGRILYEEGRFTTLDAERILEEALRARRRIEGAWEGA